MAAALGDSLGSFGECLHYQTIDRKYPILPPEGYNNGVCYSDDTALRLVLYDTILDSDVNAHSFAEHWARRVVDNQVYWISELFVTTLILMRDDPHEIGHKNLLGDNAAMAADPIGALYPTLDEVAALRAYETMSVCQSGKGLEGAMAVAAAVARSMTPECSIDEIVEASGKWVSKNMKDRIEKAVSIAGSSIDPRKELYDTLLVEDGLTDLIRNEISSPTPLSNTARLTNLHVSNEDISMGISPFEVVPIAIGYAAKNTADPVEAIREAARFGRDCDTIAGITGAILGAFHGTKSLQQNHSIALLPQELLVKANEIAYGMHSKASRVIDSLMERTDLTTTLFHN